MERVDGAAHLVVILGFIIVFFWMERTYGKLRIISEDLLRLHGALNIHLEDIIRRLNDISRHTDNISHQPNLSLEDIQRKLDEALRRNR
jgi:hypothetical protein